MLNKLCYVMLCYVILTAENYLCLLHGQNFEISKNKVDNLSSHQTNVHQTQNFPANDASSKDIDKRLYI